MKSGAGSEEVYKPSLWYYDLLHFLYDQDSARSARSTRMMRTNEKKMRMVLNLKMYNNRMILAKLLILHRLCQSQILMNQVHHEPLHQNQ
ncbi:hypothetical protein O3P69_005272 [Scylla paramamosain]|uniref:Uncharacterized protein n=1 Tax=Scylla paramamosain TaxID=85552 RepID=A0AAW0UB59_SCYPA